MHNRARIKLHETQEEEFNHSVDERAQQTTKQLKELGDMTLSQIWTEPWNPRQKITEQESRQSPQRNRTNHIQRAQLENECIWEMRNLHENYVRKDQELIKEITMQRQ